MNETLERVKDVQVSQSLSDTKSSGMEGVKLDFVSYSRRPPTIHTHTQERLDRIDDILKSISQQLELILTEVCEQGFSLRLVLITFRLAI